MKCPKCGHEINTASELAKLGAGKPKTMTLPTITPAEIIANDHRVAAKKTYGIGQCRECGNDFEKIKSHHAFCKGSCRESYYDVEFLHETINLLRAEIVKLEETK